MKKKNSNSNQALTADQTREIFLEIDRHLKHKTEITILGGTAIILLKYRDRSTMDIDVFPSRDATSFASVAEKLGYSVHLLTLALPVDPDEAEKESVFDGRHLHVLALSGMDLIKTKVDRYARQDREDIRAILEHIKPTKKEFFKVAHEVIQNNVGPVVRIQTTLELIIEEHFGAKTSQEFKATLK